MKISRIETGIGGLDEILDGGLPVNHTYLLMGGPGSGKTTMGLQFLLEGVRRGERVLYITLLQTELGIREMAGVHGWDLDGIEIRVLMFEADREAEFAEQTLLPSSEIQLDDVMNAIGRAVEEYQPARLVFDSIEQIRLLAGDPVIYRQKVLATQRLLSNHNVTTIFVESSEQAPEFKTLAHGVIVLDTVIPRFGEMHRRILVEKMRCVAFSGGYHSFRIRTGGVEIYPRLPVTEGKLPAAWKEVKSDIEPLDRMLGGGLTGGTACLLAGESGTGKSSMANAYVHAAARRGVKAAVFLFDERKETYLLRAKSLGMDLIPFLEDGAVTVDQVNIGDISAGELAHTLRLMVEKQGVGMVVIDSLTGFQETLPEEPQLITQLHEILGYLGQQGVLTLMIVTEHGMFGQTRGVVDASFLADSVILVRRLEAMGRMRLAVAAVKKRHGDHDKYIRELMITGEGVVVGEPLREFRGVLTGSPVFIGDTDKLME